MPTPIQLNSYGISLEQVRAALSSANADKPERRLISDGSHSWQINTTDQLFAAKEYRPLVVAWRNGAAVRLERCRERNRFRGELSEMPVFPTASLPR